MSRHRAKRFRRRVTRFRERCRQWLGKRPPAETSNPGPDPQNDRAPPERHGENTDCPPSGLEPDEPEFAPPERPTENTDCLQPSPKPNETGCALAQDPLKSLWDRAYNALKENGPKLVEEYEGLLSDELTTIDAMADGANGTTTTNKSDNLGQAQLQVITERGIKRLDEDKLKWIIAGHEIAVGDRIAQAADLVLWAKDWISLATKASPEASIIWAGVSIVLPLLTNHRTAEEANREGFIYSQVFRLAQSGAVAGDLMAEKILEFQVRSVLRLYQRRRKTLAKDVLGCDDWAGWRTEITNREDVVNQDLGRINAFAARGELEKLSKASIEYFSAMQEFLATNQEHLQVAKQTLQIQTSIVKQSLTDKEQKCHQQFRLAEGTKDVSYEWYKNRVEDRVEDTCQWFIGHDNFKQWLGQDSGPLLVSADPGCGKSVLAKYLIDQVLPRTNASVCYFFFKDQDQNTVRQALCALLHQLFTHKPLLIRHACDEPDARDGSTLVNNTATLWSILEDALQDAQAGLVILVFDALDECLTSELENLVEKLKQLHRKMRGGYHAKLRTLLTCRPYEGILEQFGDLSEDFPFIRIPGEDESEAIAKEVNLVVDHRVEQLARKKALRDDVKRRLKERLLEIEHRTYLWVYLVFDYLKQFDLKRTPKGVDESIATLPENVNQAYEKILSRSDKADMVRKALSIILVASRPLTLSEMNIAVNTNTDASSLEDLDLEPEEDFQTHLREWCGLFVSVYHGKIYFLHQTAREFLLAPPSPLTGSIPNSHWHHSISARDAHKVLAEICITYLVFFESLETSLGDRYDNFFRYYSADYWPGHFREAQFSGSDSIVGRASRLLGPDLLEWYWIYEEWPKDDDGKTALVTAALHGHEAIVKLLLDNGANIEAKDGFDRRPLCWAAGMSCEGVVALLLDKGANVEAKDEAGLTPLRWASENGKGANIEAKDDDGKTALSWAALHGHEAIVKLLLDKGANAIVTLLLGTGADIEAKDQFGRTPLALATEKGYKGVVKLLLDKGANIEAKDASGQTLS
ncbi:hypothetical protein F5144DRAFT_592173 [Chaetomium tenue]|uniref:Uncharacterized protein n=1 Tax=Chaetomium tenue TaxID=1854479 RepID=A0ACB7PDU8_9PEZI|nr:hypothetical protein F5144DRAFT_592173 [Chaetomium globosum]